MSCFKCEYGEDASMIKLSKDIREYGCSVIAVTNGHLYTLGISLIQKKPELFIPSFLPQEMAFMVANKYNEFLKEGRDFQLDVVYADFQEFLSVDVVFKKVNKNRYHDYFGMAIDFYGDDSFEVWQMVLPDKNGFFPWSEECDHFFKREEFTLFNQQ